jgi:hypothetical protein
MALKLTIVRLGPEVDAIISEKMDCLQLIGNAKILLLPLKTEANVR